MRTELCRPGLSRVMDVRRTDGVTAAYLVVTNQQAYRATSSGPNIAVSYTPQIDVWWDVRACCGILQKTDAAYHYGYGNLWLSRADTQGQTRAQQIWTQYSTVNQFGFRHMHRRFPVLAGGAITATWMHENGGGTWQFYMDSLRNFIEAKAYER